MAVRIRGRSPAIVQRSLGLIACLLVLPACLHSHQQPHYESTMAGDFTIALDLYSELMLPNTQAHLPDFPISAHRDELERKFCEVSKRFDSPPAVLFLSNRL